MAIQIEPWLRGTHGEVDALRRQVIHALELAEEDVVRWAKPLADIELEARPLGLPSVAFQMRHMARSLDRLLTYAEGRALDDGQRAGLGSEHEAGGREALLAEFTAALDQAKRRVLRFQDSFEAARFVGRDRLPATLGGLLVHCAEHTQRHAGQMVTTAKVIAATR